MRSRRKRPPAAMTADQTASSSSSGSAISFCSPPGRRRCSTASSRSPPASPRRWTRSRERSGWSAIPTTRRSQTVRFPSNWELSIERAKAVAAVLKRASSDPGRVDDRRQGRRRADRTQCHAGGPREEPARRNHDRTRANSGQRETEHGIRRCSARNLRIVLVRHRSRLAGALVYLAGPLIAFGDWRPLENYDRPRHRHPAVSSPPPRLRRLQFLPAAQGRQEDRRRHQRRRPREQRRARPQGADEGRAGDAEDRERRQVRLSLRPALVCDDRPAGLRQDHGAGQFRAEISACRAARRRPRSRASAARGTATGGSPKTRC